MSEVMFFLCDRCGAFTPLPRMLRNASTVSNSTVDCINPRCRKPLGMGLVTRIDGELVQVKRSSTDAPAFRARVESATKRIQEAKDSAEVERTLDEIATDDDVPELLKEAAKWLKALYKAGGIKSRPLKIIGLVLLAVLGYCMREDEKAKERQRAEPREPNQVIINNIFSSTVNVDQSLQKEEAAREKGASGH